MKQILLLTALVVLGGCASSATNDRLDALERQVGDAQRTASEALDLAKRSADGQSSQASDVAEAKRMARQALDTATETAERLSRMQDECCARK